MAWMSRVITEGTLNALAPLAPPPDYREQCSECMSREPSRQEMAKFKPSRQKRFKQSGKDWYIENNWQLFAMVRQVFPDAKLVHIIQNVREVVTSLLNQFVYINQKPLSPRHGPKTDSARSCWAGWNPLQKAAWHWKTVRAAFRPMPNGRKTGNTSLMISPGRPWSCSGIMKSETVSTFNRWQVPVNRYGQV
ncbi:MAG: hypothetical protein ACI9TH_004187 [Kiritimatiellia bacterium]|jgi:hypothetical protein